MTTPDRTEELLRLMLERRAGAPPPGWLLPGLAEQVRQTRQARARPSLPGVPVRGRGRRLALGAVAALVLLALPAGMLVTGRLTNRAPAATQPAIGLAPSPSVAVTANPSQAPQASDAPSQAATPEPGVPIAVVTAAGDGLRVRSRPEVSADSKKLAPLLAAGSRMLVVNGPVPADGYDWYEVRADNDLFGWVAAGKDGVDWIAPAAANCTDDLDESALWTVDPIDFFVCYGDTPVSVRARKGVTSEPGTEGGPLCPYTGDDIHCTPRPQWLFDGLALDFAAPSASGRTLLVAAKGAMADRISKAPAETAMTLTVAMDAPQAQNCRVVDDRGRDLISRDEAVTRCRMQFVVRDVASDP
jgi:hypothetical protein